MGKSNNPAWGEWVASKIAYNRITQQESKVSDNEKLYFNGIYQVCLTELGKEGRAGALHLSIHRRDRKAIHDWRHFQRIKNELAGEEREGMEIYPPESNLFDGANEYHLWVMPEGENSPFVVKQHRQVADDPQIIGAVQRPYGEEL